jgi:hypothetical protein
MIHAENVRPSVVLASPSLAWVVTDRPAWWGRYLDVVVIVLPWLGCHSFMKGQPYSDGFLINN